MSEPSILNVKSLKEQVYEYLRQQMSSGDLHPGSVIDLNATSKKLGISKTPLRDALIMLESEGFVEILPRRGVYVKTLSLQEIREFYQIIGALESTALLASANRLGSSELTAMRDLNTAMKRALDENDFDTYYARNLAFHDLYIGCSGNTTLAKTVHLLKKRLYDFPRQVGFVKEWEYASIGEHQRIIDLLAAGDVKGAAGYIRDIHWSFETQENFINQYYRNIE